MRERHQRGFRLLGRGELDNEDLSRPQAYSCRSRLEHRVCGRPLRSSAQPVRQGQVRIGRRNAVTSQLDRHGCICYVQCPQRDESSASQEPRHHRPAKARGPVTTPHTTSRGASVTLRPTQRMTS